jgi:hypothetical protein
MFEIGQAVDDALSMECLHQRLRSLALHDEREDRISIFYIPIRFCERGLPIRIAMLK